MIFITAVFGFILYVLFKTFVEGNMPVSGPLTEDNAVAVTKRMQIRGGENASMAYYVTFETEDGVRTELSVRDTQYGEIAEGDRGVLQRRGGRFAGFIRSESRYSAEDPDNATHRCPACGATYVGRVCDYCDTPWVDNDER